VHHYGGSLIKTKFSLMSKPWASGNGEEIGGKKIKSSVGCGESTVEYNGEEDLEAAKTKEGELVYSANGDWLWWMVWAWHWWERLNWWTVVKLPKHQKPERNRGGMTVTATGALVWLWHNYLGYLPFTPLISMFLVFIIQWVVLSFHFDVCDSIIC